TLRDENPTNKRAGETWMRYNHKAYYRILQPMIAIFCDSSILRRRAEVLIDGEVYETLHYQRPFNQAQIDYVFETLLSMCHVGGKSFLKAIQKTVDKVDIFSKCSWLPENIPSLTYSEILLHLVLTSVITISSFDENVISGSSSSTSNSIPYIIQLSVLLNAISKLSNRPLLQEWMDFIQMSLPYFRQSFNIILVPLIRSLCEQLSKWKTDTQNHYTIIAHIGKPTPVECKTSHHDSAT
ncbi:11468_t:CDS:2, partial [Entrophospora sp. SA101]